MRYLIALIIIINFLNKASACLNEYGRNLQGKMVYTKWFTISEKAKHHNLKKIKKGLSIALEKLDGDSTFYQEWSNISVYYMKLGKVDTALKILQPLIKKHANEYKLIANIGTAYELSGKLDSALKYINLGYQINPKSHYGSEWIHIKILEAKIKHKQQPERLISNSILSAKLLKEKMNKNGLRRLDEQIKTQILTRVPFTPSPNKVIQNILFSMGRLHHADGAYESAFLYYAYAYEFTNNQYRKNTIKMLLEKLNKQRLQNNNNIKLPFHFTKTLARSRIDLSLLTLGLDQFAHYQDSVHTVLKVEQDSIAILTEKIDSILNAPKKIESIIIEKPVEVVVKKVNWILTIGFGLVVGLVAILVYKKVKS